MGITFKTLYNRLIGAVDVIPNPFARAAINDALREIYDYRDWGFLWKNGFIRTPAAIDGNASVTKYLDVITVDAPTLAKINLIELGDVPLEERQIKFYGTNKVQRNSAYNIVDFDTNTGEITLDREFLDDTNVNIKIKILKMYYTAPYVLIDGNPEIDFRRFGYIFSHFINRRVNHTTTLEELNQFDPTRSKLSSIAYPSYFIPYQANENGEVLYEFYPHPTQEANYPIRFLSNGIKLVKDTDSIPLVISEELVLAKAKQKAYEWVIANGQQKQLKVTTAYANMIAMLENPNNSSSYPRLLAKAEKKDEDLYPQAYLGDYSYYDCVGYLGDYNSYYPHDRFGDTLVIDAAAPTIDIEL